MKKNNEVPIVTTEVDLEAEVKKMVYDPFYDLDGVALKGTSAYITVEDVANIARYFAEWGAEHADKPVYTVSSKGKSAMGDKFYDWLQFGTHAIWDWMVKTNWYKKLSDMSDELIVKIYLGKKHSKK